jgi:hypothetical protein
MANLQDSHRPKLLGAGRSGKVFLVKNETTSIARKIFYADKLANIIHYIFFGSPNPYIWNQDVISCAFYRRKILGQLVRFWFDDNLRVADAIAIAWNPEFKAYQLDTEFIQGRHVALCQPFSRNRVHEFPALAKGIMEPLQKKLIQAGLDGLVWQAGKGTPTALNNFLLATDNPEKDTFVWIDLESGVPALFPLNILILLKFYLPKAFKYGRVLFDDVNTTKLKHYVNICKFDLQDKLGIEAYNKLVEDISKLEHHQKKWHSMGRFERSIQSQVKTGLIDEQQAQWFSEHPWFWYMRELLRVLRKLLKIMFITMPVKIFTKIMSLPYKNFIENFGKFIFSERYRLQIARNYINKRITYWQDRKQLESENIDSLLQLANSESSSSYLYDFGVHIGIKIFLNGSEFFLVPLLYVSGFINEVIFTSWVIAGGPIYRTIYTLWRMMQSYKNREEIPWIAFVVGLIPTFGFLAYPCQIIYSAHGRKKKISQFIIYDFLTRIGKLIPIFGGEDTQTEHFFNRLADKIAQ